MNSLVALDDMDLGFGNTNNYVEPVQKTFKMGSAGSERVQHFKLEGGSQKQDGTYGDRFVTLATPERKDLAVKIPADDFTGLKAQVLNIRGGFQLTCTHTPFKGKTQPMKWVTYGAELDSFLKGLNDFFTVYPQALLQCKKLLNQLPQKTDIIEKEDGSIQEVSVYDPNGAEKPLYLHTYSQLRYLIQILDKPFREKGIAENLLESFNDFEKSVKIKVSVAMKDTASNVYAYFEDHTDDIIANMEKMAKNGENCDKFYQAGKAGPVKPDMQFFPFKVKYPASNYKAGQFMNIFETVPGVSGRTTASRLRVAEPTPRIRFSLLEKSDNFNLEADGAEYRLDTYSNKDSMPLWNFLLQELRKDLGLSDDDFWTMLEEKMAKVSPKVIIQEFLEPTILIDMIQENLEKNPMNIEIGLNKQPSYYAFTVKRLDK